jgi:hypothetical protein
MITAKVPINLILNITCLFISLVGVGLVCCNPACISASRSGNTSLAAPRNNQQPPVLDDTHHAMLSANQIFDTSQRNTLQWFLKTGIPDS